MNHPLRWFSSLMLLLVAATSPLTAAEMPADEAWQALPAYEYGQDMAPLLAIDREVIRAMSSPESRAACATRLAALLEADGTTPAARQYICLQLRQVGTAEQVPLLGRLLVQPETSQMARYALQAIPGEAAIAALRDGLNRLDGPLQIGVIQSLAARGDEGSVTELVQLADSADPAVSAAAVRALGDIGGQAATQYLAASAARAGAATPRDLAASLLKCAARLADAGEREAARAIYAQLSAVEQPAGTRRAALSALLDLAGDQMPVTILAWLASDDRQQRQVAAARMGRLTDDQLQRLATRPEDLPDAAHAALLELLAMRRGPEALPMVLKAATSDNAQLRRAGIRCLGLIGDAGTIPMLLDTLAEGDDLASAAGQALTAMPREQVGPALLKALNDRPDMRPAVVDVLKKLVYYEAIDPLIAIAANDDPAVYEVALDGLRGIADPDPTDTPRLLRLLERATPGKHRDEVEKTVLIVCEKQPPGADRAGPVLKALGNVDLTKSAVYLPLLGRLGGPQALKIIETALSSDDATVREAAVRGLCNWPDASVADRLIALARDSENRGHRQWALRAYVRVITLPSDRPEDQTLAMLQSAMQQADNVDDKRLILTRAGTVRTMAAVDWIAGYLDQPDLAQQAGASLVELAHHRFLRQPNMQRFRPILQRVAEISRDEEVVDRAKRYQLGL